MAPTTTTPQLPFFVYGSLRPGFHNYSPFIGPFEHTMEEGVIAGVDMFARANHYPYLTDGDGSAVGNLVYVNAEDFLAMLEMLDELEDYDSTSNDNHYDRRVMDVETVNGTVDAYVYIASPYFAARARRTLAQVTSGDWAEWCANYDDGSTTRDRGDVRLDSNGHPYYANN